MEVHQPHHPTHKKKWSEYIIEFVMLFAAVTLGFFAENVREHQVVQHKTNQNLQSVILDLRKDSTLIQNRIKEYSEASIVLEALNQLFIDYQQLNFSKNDYLDSAIELSNHLRFGTSFYINNASYKNTIASGSFSNISSIELKRTISDYYEVYGAKLSDNNRILDDVVEYYNIYTLPEPGGRFGKNRTKLEKKQMKELYKSRNLFNNNLLKNEFIIYNQKAKDRVELYLSLMEIFHEKNSELLVLLKKHIDKE